MTDTLEKPRATYGFASLSNFRPASPPVLHDVQEVSVTSQPHMGVIAAMVSHIVAEIQPVRAVDPVVVPAAKSDDMSVCLIQDGLTFTGDAVLAGSCHIAGTVFGNLRAATGSKGHIVITGTGVVLGEIHSPKVTISGKFDGVVDASGGSVELMAESSVSGRVRYTQLQVNGADLNATLERVAKAAL